MAKEEKKDVKEEITIETSKNDFGDRVPEIDQKAIEVTQGLIEDKKEEMEGKLYSVRISSELTLDRLIDFINNHAKWSNKEALGIIESSKALLECKEEGIKEGFIFMESLHIQAMHYFVSKTTGQGIKEAKAHVELLKILDEALERTSEDVRRLKELEKELAGLQQGLKTE